MPKKQPRNAFYFFMVDFKEEQRKKGINYENMAAVAEAAGPLWRDAPPPIRSKFEAKAKAEKQKNNIPLKKLTSTGISIADIEQEQRDLADAEENEKKDMRNLVKLKAFTGVIRDEDFYLIDVNVFCKTSTDYVFGESTILRFNLVEGIKDHYHEELNPAAIPLGYAYDVKAGAEELGLVMPDADRPRSNYMQILANIIDYLRQQSNEKVLPPLFTLPDKVDEVQAFIMQLCSRASEDDSLFRVYKLDTLFFTLINAVKDNPNEGFPKESLAMVQLRKDPFKYTPGLACEHHESIDKAVECTTSRSKRWAYTILDSCCPIMGLDIIPGKHIPFDYDIDSILNHKEQKKERAGPTVAGYNVAPSSCNTTNDSLNEGLFTTVSTSSKREKRTHAPLRMPQADYSKNIRKAPELTETNFPTLSAGMGRGRGLAGSFNKMKLDN